MEKVYFIADTHFFDDTIWRYENRPFKTISEMNSEMISLWNSFIYPEDSVKVFFAFVLYLSFMCYFMKDLFK